MKNNSEFKKGFTLLEVLIATGVFAVVMLMTTSIISQSAGYQSKIKAIRQTSEESSHLSDMLARDLRAATGSFKLSLTPTDPSPKNIKNGVALIRCSATGCALNAKDMASPQDVSSVPLDAISDTIIISQKNDAGDQVFKIYQDQPTGSGSYKSVDGKTVSAAVLAPALNPWFKNGNLSLVNAANVPVLTGLTPLTNITQLETYIDFSGYTRVGDAAVQKQQSYVSYSIHTQTKDFALLNPSRRAETTIRSMITMRNYAQ